MLLFIIQKYWISKCEADFASFCGMKIEVYLRLCVCVCASAHVRSEIHLNSSVPLSLVLTGCRAHRWRISVAFSPDSLASPSSTTSETQESALPCPFEGGTLLLVASIFPIARFPRRLNKGFHGFELVPLLGYFTAPRNWHIWVKCFEFLSRSTGFIVFRLGFSIQCGCLNGQWRNR